jgi:hypothetical protein
LLVLRGAGQVIGVESRTEMRISQHAFDYAATSCRESRGSSFAMHPKRQWIPTTWKEVQEHSTKAVVKNVATVSSRFNTLAF